MGRDGLDHVTVCVVLCQLACDQLSGPQSLWSHRTFVISGPPRPQGVSRFSERLWDINLASFEVWSDSFEGESVGFNAEPATMASR